MTDVDLSFNETLKWIFFGLIVKIWQCNLDPIGISVQSESLPNHIEQLVENAEIVIYNSSFSSLDLNPGIKAQITECYIDAQFKPRPTLITANNSDVSIQNCHFGNFMNEDDSTILYGHDNSHITIENSVFIQHSSSKGVLFLHNNSSVRISGSSISQNIASSPGYSSITLQDRIHVDVHNTVFKNNSALVGGAMIAQDECQVTLKNCNFSSNKAIIGKTSHILKNSKVHTAARTLDQNTIRLYAPISPTLFNQASLGDKKRKVIAPHLLVKSSFLKKISVQKEDGLLKPNPGQGGVIYVATRSQLLVTNCTFEDNSAQFVAGAISADSNVTLHVQETTFVGNKAQDAGAICAYLNATLHIEETTFVGNKATEGGAINIQQQSQLRMTNCVFDDNISRQLGGAITASYNATVHIEETTFVGNKAQLGAGAIGAALNATLQIEETTFVGNKAPGDGGAIDIQQQSQLRMKNCVFDDNISRQLGGAICAGLNATLYIEETSFVANKAQGRGAIAAGQNAALHIEEITFVGNKALGDGGAISIEQEAYLRMTNCVLNDNISGHHGGAIVAGGNATLEVKATNFTGNSALYGGAIVVYQQAYLHTTDCTFKDNRAEQIGGGIAGSLQAVLEINGSYFSNNSAIHGGAINFQQQANLSLTNCRLERNIARDHGGAILAWTNVILRIRETNFTGNSAYDGGALCVGALTDCHVVQSVFNYNTAKGPGGAVYADSKSSVQLETINFTNNNATDGGAIYIQENSKLQTNMSNFWKNLAKRAGGAIMLKGYSTAVIESCHFLSNHAVSGGAVSVNQPEHVSVLSTLLLRNIASETGGAISISNGTDVIINNITCVGNQGPNGGGCLYLESVTLTLKNNDISENSANQFGAGVTTQNSRIQVGISLSNETTYIRYFYCKYHRCGSLFLPGVPIFSVMKDNFVSLA